jgi:hypothetical protein
MAMRIFNTLREIYAHKELHYSYSELSLNIIFPKMYTQLLTISFLSTYLSMLLSSEIDNLPDRTSHFPRC